MLDDYTRGGQIFIHKVRMFRQVIGISTFWSFVIAALLVIFITLPQYKAINMFAAKTYMRASFVEFIWDITPKISEDSKRREPRIDIYDMSINRALRSVKVATILNNPKYEQSYMMLKQYIVSTSLLAAGSTIFLVFLVFMIWSKFGKTARATKHISGSTIKTASEVKQYLKKHNLIGKFHIGDMPLIKDTETRHFLVTGSTGSGKTNLINTLLPQVRDAKHPAIVVDQTGEMIERYYDPNRGDIIFNPLDARSHSWDFWQDATSNNVAIGEVDLRLEKFAKVLFSFDKHSTGSGNDQFWQNSAEILEKEMESHIGYEKHSKNEKDSDNRRNGNYEKTLIDPEGRKLTVEVPRDRDGEFEPQLIPKGVRKFEGFDDKVISLYARGMTIREIQGHLEELYATKVSSELISKVTDGILEEVTAWQNRALDNVYPIMYLDCIHVKARDNHGLY